MAIHKCLTPGRAPRRASPQLNAPCSDSAQAGDLSVCLRFNRGLENEAAGGGAASEHGTLDYAVDRQGNEVVVLTGGGHVRVASAQRALPRRLYPGDARRRTHSKPRRRCSRRKHATLTAKTGVLFSWCWSRGALCSSGEMSRSSGRSLGSPAAVGASHGGLSPQRARCRHDAPVCRRRAAGGSGC